MMVNSDSPAPADGVFYLCFTKNHDKADALRRYRERFGVDPKEVLTEKLILWLGPVPKKAED